MDKKIVTEWINELKKFDKEPSYRQLRFPMFMESAKGDLLSPEGILCNMHMKAGLGKWLPEYGEDKKLRGYTHYDGESHVAPASVLKWVGISAAIAAEVRRVNGENCFDGAIKYLEALNG